MSTKELLVNLQAARIASQAKPLDKQLSDHWDRSYQAVFSQDRISAMTRAYEQQPGLRPIPDPQNVSPVVWEFWPSNTLVAL